MPRVESPASEDHDAVGRRRLLGGTTRRAAVVLVLVGVFLTVGLPRFLARDDAPNTSGSGANFTKLCRDHGGTPRTRPASGTNAEPQPFCTVRYGQHVYLMDAITPNGFDADTARFQRQGCEEAAREQRGSSAAGRETFVYHPTTGVCEHRP